MCLRVFACACVCLCVLECACVYLCVLVLVCMCMCMCCSLFPFAQNTVDSSLPESISGLMFTLCSILNTVVVISFVTPLFLTLIVPLMFIYGFTQRFYVATSRELKRLESVSKVCWFKCLVRC